MTSPSLEMKHYARDAEQTRQQLTETVDTIRDRITDAVSPSHVGRDLQNFLIKKTRENPLQAAGILAGLAFPISRLVASIPAPVLLVGAGIALSRSEVTGAVAGAFETAEDSTRGAMADASEGLANVGDRAAKVANDAATKLSDQAGDLKETVTDAMETASASISSTAGDIVRTSQDYPLSLGLIGLAVGAVLGGALPISRSEQETFGELSDTVKGQASTLASAGVEAAENAAEAVYDELAAEADAQGLTAGAAAEAVDTLKAKASDVVKETQGRNASNKRS